jgi:hypothetical protein
MFKAWIEIKMYFINSSMIKRKRWLIIKNKIQIKELAANEFQVNKNVAYIKLTKKNGSTVDTKIDAEDLQKVLDNGPWFAEWNKDYNSYLAQHYTDTSGRKGKQSLQSFILGVDSKVPVKHLNNDILDNRKSNLEVFNKNSYNEYKEINAETVEIILRDSQGIEHGRTIIDKEDLYKVLNNGYPWEYYRSTDKPYAIANTPKGRLFLDRFIMDTPEDMITHHINLNTLDNRKNNLENLKKSQE